MKNKVKRYKYGSSKKKLTKPKKYFVGGALSAGGGILGQQVGKALGNEQLGQGIGQMAGAAGGLMMGDPTGVMGGIHGLGTTVNQFPHGGDGSTPQFNIDTSLFQEEQPEDLGFDPRPYQQTTSPFSQEIQRTFGNQFDINNPNREQVAAMQKWGIGRDTLEKIQGGTPIEDIDREYYQDIQKQSKQNQQQKQTQPAVVTRTPKSDPRYRPSLRYGGDGKPTPEFDLDSIPLEEEQPVPLGFNYQDYLPKDNIDELELDRNREYIDRHGQRKEIPTFRHGGQAAQVEGEEVQLHGDGQVTEFNEPQHQQMPDSHANTVMGEEDYILSDHDDMVITPEKAEALEQVAGIEVPEKAIGKTPAQGFKEVSKKITNKLKQLKDKEDNFSRTTEKLLQERLNQLKEPFIAINENLKPDQEGQQQEQIQQGQEDFHMKYGGTKPKKYQPGGYGEPTDYLMRGQGQQEDVVPTNQGSPETTQGQGFDYGKAAYYGSQALPAMYNLGHALAPLHEVDRQDYMMETPTVDRDPIFRRMERERDISRTVGDRAARQMGAGSLAAKTTGAATRDAEFAGRFGEAGVQMDEIDAQRRMGVDRQNIGTGLAIEDMNQRARGARQRFGAAAATQGAQLGAMARRDQNLTGRDDLLRTQWENMTEQQKVQAQAQHQQRQLMNILGPDAAQYFGSYS